MQCLAPEKAFLNLTKKSVVNYEATKALIIPFGLEHSVSYGCGTHHGPKAMIHASHEVELFDETLWCEPYRRINVVTLEEPTIEKEISKALEQLENLVEQVTPG